METFRDFLLKSRQRSAKMAPPIEEVIRGNIVTVERTCGKKNCRCRSGLKHRSLYVSQSDKGKTRMVYIPKKFEAETIRLVQNYKRLKAALSRVSEYNLMMVSSSKVR